MEQEKEILNSGEAAARKDVEMEKEAVAEETAGGEKNEIELFAEEMKAETRAFEQTIALTASLRKEKIAEVKEDQQTILATAENLPDAHQLKKEYESAWQNAEGELALAENFKQEAAKRLKTLQDLNIRPVAK